MSPEIWKWVSECVGAYQVSNNGAMKSVDRVIVDCDGKRMRRVNGKVLSCYTNKKGYRYVYIRVNGKGKNCKVARIVAETFIDNPDDLETVNHIDGDKQNDCVENLEWLSMKDNIRHAIDIGLIDINGESHPMSKLSEGDVVKIRRLHDSGGYTYRELGKKYGVTGPTVQKVVERKLWRHI